MAKVKIGVIGVGKMGQFHANLLKSAKEASLVGVFDADQQRSAEVAEKLKVKTYGSYELMLGDVEAVVIATPTPSHAEIAKDCILAGKHILVEKPLASTSEDGRVVAALAKDKNLKCSVGMIERFNPAFIKLSKLLKGQKIIGIEIKRLSPYPERIKESVVFDMMIHDIDLASKLNHSPVEDIRAYGKKNRSSTLDEVLATIYYKDGLIAKLDASRLKDFKERKVIITTDKGIYEADLLNKKLFFRVFDDLSAKQEIELSKDDQLSSELKCFILSIVNDRVPESSLEDAVQSLKTAEEVEKLACS